MEKYHSFWELTRHSWPFILMAHYHRAHDKPGEEPPEKPTWVQRVAAGAVVPALIALLSSAGGSVITLKVLANDFEHLRYELRKEAAELRRETTDMRNAFGGLENRLYQHILTHQGLSVPHPPGFAPQSVLPPRGGEERK